MRLLSIASGSSGNCIYVGSEDTHILIDAGISGKRVEAGLNSIGLAAADLDAVFITHEHIDHVGGLGVLARKCAVPIYATRGTIEGIRGIKSVGVINEELYHVIDSKETCQLGKLLIMPFAISHDANEPVAYRINADEKSLGIVTDLGIVTEDILAGFQDMDALFIEANHDERMLQVGPYPYYLKKRILGKKGHLSNESSGKFLNGLLNERLKYIMLGHLSHENNLPELAFEAVRLEIEMGDNPYRAADFNIRIAKRCEPSPLIEF